MFKLIREFLDYNNTFGDVHAGEAFGRNLNQWFCRTTSHPQKQQLIKTGRMRHTSPISILSTDVTQEIDGPLQEKW